MRPVEEYCLLTSLGHAQSDADTSATEENKNEIPRLESLKQHFIAAINKYEQNGLKKVKGKKDVTT